MKYICTLVIMLPGGYREVLEAEGVDLDRDGADTYLIDFTDYLVKHGYAKHLPKTVYRVRDNSCVLANPR